MPSTLIFPDGARLAARDEIPGPEVERAKEWSRIERANIAPGFVLKPSGDESFAFYAEVNVDAPQAWRLFRGLCGAVLPPNGDLLFADSDDQPEVIWSGAVAKMLSVLEEHGYQLSHDGYLHFGIVSTEGGLINEVFVAPTKHLKIWFNDERTVQTVMSKFGLPKAERLEFLDEYPRTTMKLPRDKAISDVLEFAQLMVSKLNGAGVN
jgi:hypothetical protein